MFVLKVLLSWMASAAIFSSCGAPQEEKIDFVELESEEGEEPVSWSLPAQVVLEEEGEEKLIFEREGL